MSDIAKCTGERIRELRKEKGISQEELALRANIHPSHMGKIERGEKSPTIDSLEKIVIALDTTFQELFSFTVPISSKKIETSVTDKINVKLSSRSLKDQLAIYRLIKLVLWWKDK